MTEHDGDIGGFESLASGDAARVGGKNASLGETVRRLEHEGLRAPERMKRPPARAAVVLAASLLASPAAAQIYGDGMGMWHGVWGWGHMMIGGLLMLLFWAAVIVLIVRGLSGSTREQRRPARSALQILEERFARGEIEREEFEEKRRLLAGETGGQKGKRP